MPNHLHSELEWLSYRLFSSKSFAKRSRIATYTRNGEHNSVIWLYGHIGFIIDDLILRCWKENGKNSFIN